MDFNSSGEEIRILQVLMTSVYPPLLSIHVLNPLQLYAGSDKPIAVFRRFSQPQPTAIGPAHGHFQYSFTRDNLLVESLVALCVNRWIDLHMDPIYSAGL